MFLNGESITAVAVALVCEKPASVKLDYKNVEITYRICQTDCSYMLELVLDAAVGDLTHAADQCDQWSLGGGGGGLAAAFVVVASSIART